MDLKNSIDSYIILAGFTDSKATPFLVIHRRGNKTVPKDEDATSKLDRVNYPIIESSDPTKRADCVFNRTQIKDYVASIRKYENKDSTIYHYIRKNLLAHQLISVTRFRKHFLK